MSTIKGAEYPLSKVLSSQFEFHIPEYQRPYAWTQEQASELFSDILGVVDAEGETEKYFLGSIVLVKKDEDKKEADVVDGQQRLTTLTLLLSAISNKLASDVQWSGSFDGFVREQGNLALMLDAKPRLFLRERDRDFFAKYVQAPKQFGDLLALDGGKLSESQRNITENARLFSTQLDPMPIHQIGKLGQFIVNSCYLVVVTTDSFQSAYRIFSILNDRGLALEPSDILKAETIGRIPEAKRATYTELWEDLEEQSGRKAFNELITHIRMIYRKEKARRSQLDEFKEHVVEKIPTAEALVDDVLKPYADAFEIIRNAAYESTHQADKVNRLLEWLLRITNQDWIPVAMYLVHKDDVDTERLIRHLIQLERLAASMFIRGIYVTPRIERFGKVLAAIAEGADLEASGSPLNLASEEVEATLRELDKPVYKFSAKLRSYILLRLDSLLADAGAIFQHSVTTIEHVLPQTVPTGSEWDQLWTQTDRQYWTDRIGNLVLLSRAKNSEAQNFSFTEKKQKYFTSKTGVCSFASTTQVLTYEHWSVQEVQDRQAQVLARFKAWLLV